MMSGFSYFIVYMKIQSESFLNIWSISSAICWKSGDSSSETFITDTFFLFAATPGFLSSFSEMISDGLSITTIASA